MLNIEKMRYSFFVFLEKANEIFTQLCHEVARSSCYASCS
jgi:hypothetical protein